jgi:hypothetical protein
MVRNSRRVSGVSNRSSALADSMLGKAASGGGTVAAGDSTHFSEQLAQRLHLHFFVLSVVSLSPITSLPTPRILNSVRPRPGNQRAADRRL